MTYRRCFTVVIYYKKKIAENTKLNKVKTNIKPIE